MLVEALYNDYNYCIVLVHIIIIKLLFMIVIVIMFRIIDLIHTLIYLIDTLIQFNLLETSNSCENLHTVIYSVKMNYYQYLQNF